LGQIVSRDDDTENTFEGGCDVNDGAVPGEVLPAEGAVTINEGRETATVSVANTGDRPAQVGSHFHFFEVNRALEFDRVAAFGKRLNVPAGTAVRFEPGDEKEVELVELGGRKRAVGMNNLTDGTVERDPVEAAREAGFEVAEGEDE